MHGACRRVPAVQVVAAVPSGNRPRTYCQHAVPSDTCFCSAGWKRCQYLTAPYNNPCLPACLPPFLPPSLPASLAASGDTVPRAYDEYDVSDRLKESGWVLPAYSMAPNAGHIKLLRAVIR